MPYTTESNLIHLERIDTRLFEIERRVNLNGLQDEIQGGFLNLAGGTHK
jgi:hypothetical protein